MVVIFLIQVVTLVTGFVLTQISYADLNLAFICNGIGIFLMIISFSWFCIMEKRLKLVRNWVMRKYESSGRKTLE